LLFSSDSSELQIPLFIFFPIIFTFLIKSTEHEVGILSFHNM
jgi:hypothetical protein